MQIILAVICYGQGKSSGAMNLLTIACSSKC